MLINFLITAAILWNSESWASLMLVVSGYNIMGYMAAPISMGAISPKTRVFGAIVFALIGLMMSTITAYDLFLIDTSIMLLLIIYGTINIMNKQVTIKHLATLNLPIIAYLWSLYFSQNPIYSIVMAVVFYTFVTHPKYVAFCRRLRAPEIDEETKIQL
jgi:hypothetical protein